MDQDLLRTTQNQLSRQKKCFIRFYNFWKMDIKQLSITKWDYQNYWARLNLKPDLIKS